MALADRFAYCIGQKRVRGGDRTDHLGKMNNVFCGFPPAFNKRELPDSSEPDVELPSYVMQAYASKCDLFNQSVAYLFSPYLIIRRSMIIADVF